MNKELISQTKISFIGGGNMARSIIGGLISTGFKPKQIIVSDPFQASLDNCAELGVATCSDNNVAIEHSDIIVLAVKPQIMREVCLGMREKLAQQDQCLIISIAAGISSDHLDNWLGGNIAIVRCMPNTPALLQLGASALFKNKTVDNQQSQQAELILSAVGIALWVDEENKLDAVTALSGSGPAYFFLLIEAMTEAAVKLGLDQQTATTLCLQTALGAASMAANSDVNVAELRRRVTSPNGTTEAAINSFQSSDFQALVKAAMQAAHNRSIELANSLAD